MTQLLHSAFSAHRRVRPVAQVEAAECGLACLAMVASYHGLDVDMPLLRRRFKMSIRGLTLRNLITIADQLGLISRAVRTDIDGLSSLPMPCILHWDMNHYVVLEKTAAGKAYIHDPGGRSSWLPNVARDAWEHGGYTVRGAALSGIAAENLEHGSGIASRTIASLEHRWARDDDLLTSRDVLVIDEAGMIGTRQLERVIAEAERRGAKVVLVGDPEQLQAIEAGAAFRATAERHGSVEMTQVRRQREDWQRDATRHLATGRTAEAIDAYQRRGSVHTAATRDGSRADLVKRWDRDRTSSPDASRIILTHTSDEVQALNIAARDRLRAGGALGDDVALTVERGSRVFARGDRIMFLRNEHSLGVKNGSLGTVQAVNQVRMAVMLDDGRSVAFDHKDYAQIDHGYAATIHKAQGMTVDRVHVLATQGLDRHSAYVALSRHRDRVDLHYGHDDFVDQTRLVRTLSRERGKDMASDYGPVLEQVTASQPVRSPFAGLKLRSAPILTPEVTPLDNAVQQFARALSDVQRMRALCGRELPHHSKAYLDSVAGLDALRPNGARDLQAVLTARPEQVDLVANGKTTGAAIRMMALEAEVRMDVARRADQFVTAWQHNTQRLVTAERDGEVIASARARDNLTSMAKSLYRDPQLESVLRNRVRDLGIGRGSGASLSQDLLKSPALSRGRGLGR